MRVLRCSFYVIWSLLAVVDIYPQPRQSSLPPFLRGSWTKQEVTFGESNATIELPDGWSVREGGISVSAAEIPYCHIDFAVRLGNFEQRLADELADDRRISRHSMHSELSRAGGVRVVTVRYANSPGRFVEKRYFELPSAEGSTLLEWTLDAQSTSDGNDCASRLGVVAASFRLTKAR